MHDPLPPDTERTKAWMRIGTKSYRELKAIIKDAKFVRDLRQMVHYCHTGQLESYHNQRLKYCPKRIHFSYKAMECRTMLAAMECNYNVNRDKKLSQYVRFSKHAKGYVLRNVYDEKDYSWRQDILADILENAADDSDTNILEFSDFSDITTIPKRLRPDLVKPTVQELLSKRVSRF